MAKKLTQGELKALAKFLVPKINKKIKVKNLEFQKNLDKHTLSKEALVDYNRLLEIKALQENLIKENKNICGKYKINTHVSLASLHEDLAQAEYVKVTGDSKVKEITDNYWSKGYLDVQNILALLMLTTDDINKEDEIIGKVIEKLY